MSPVKQGRAGLRTLSIPGGGRDNSKGFAAVDALVALAILTTTILLALNAIQTSRRAAVAASEMRRAEDLLRYLVDTTPVKAGAVYGQTPAFAWRIDTTLTDAAGQASDVQICDQSAEARGFLSGRQYRIDSAAICQSGARP